MRSRVGLLLLIGLMAVSVSVSAAVDYCASGAFGYGASATGGGSATPVLVNSVSGLQSALNKGKNKVIIITQDLTFTTCLKVQDGENVTLLGMPGVKLTSLQQNKDNSGILYVKRFNNLIIRNLTFVGPGAYDCDGWDLLCFEGVTNAWVDHCDFQDGCDGNFDNKGNTDNVTVSWCRFRYLKAPRSGGSGGSADHRFTNLLGSSSSDAPSDGTYNFTWAYCWWDNGCKERMIRCRNASLHFLNCYWNSSVANYYIGPENADCYIEGCTFEGAPKTAKIFYQNYGGKNGAKFVNCTATKGLPSNVTDRTVVTPSEIYSYTALSASEAKAAVTNASCGAGATLTVTTAGAVSSTCDGGTPPPTVYTVTWDATTNGGSCGTATSSVTSGNAVGSLPEATKSGYTFDGWYNAPSGGTKISSSTTITDNITYYAQFTSAPVTTYYTIIWDANGGSCGTASTSVESGKAISTAIASLPTATKAGDYSFDGWYTAINGGTKITTGTVINANVTYYAHYTATSGGGGGDCTYTYAFAYAADATTAGVTNNTAAFTGFSTGSNNCTGSITIGSNTYNITKRGSNTTISISFTVPTDKVGTLYGLANSGGSSVRTLTLSDGGSYSENQSTSNSSSAATEITFSSLSAGNYTLSSTQNVSVPFLCLMLCDEGGSTPPATYTLSYDENGGSGTMAETEQTGSSVTVAANAFTAPTGYAFQEWNASMSGGGTVYSAGQELTLTEDLTIYAIWTPQSYTVTLNAESGTGGSASVKATFDEAMPSIAVPTRSGYIFKGYFIGVDGTGTQYYDENGSSTNSWAIPEDTELHAYWIAGSTPDPTGCELNFWFFKEADATANGKTNSAIFSGMVSDASDKSGSITIDGTSYSVTRRTGDNATFGQFTIPSGKTGVFYALAISSGSGDRQINLVCGTNTYELPVAGGSDSYKRIESEELPAGTYTIEREGSSNVRLGIVVVKLCEDVPAVDYTITHSASSNGTYTIQVGSESAVSTNTTAQYNQIITLAATPDAGYSLSSWTVTKESGGTVEVVGNQFTMPEDNVTISATFGTKTYTIDLNNQSATGAGTASVTATYNNNTILLVPIACPHKIGYFFDGYYTEPNGGGTLLIDRSGNFIASKSGYTDADRNWIHDADVTLYAQWTELTVTLNISPAQIDANTATNVTYTITTNAPMGTTDPYLFAIFNYGTSDYVSGYLNGDHNINGGLSTTVSANMTNGIWYTRAVILWNGSELATSDKTELQVGNDKPEFTWTYDDVMKAGGIYPVRVSSNGDADVTLTIVETIVGIDGSFTAGNPAEGTVTLGAYPEATSYTLRATSPATANFAAKTEDKTVTITRCETPDILPYKNPPTNAGNSAKPRYYCETSGVGRIMKDRTGTSSISTSSGDFPGEAWATTYFASGGHSLQAYQAGVFKVVLYVKSTSNTTQINALRYSDTYMENDGDGTDIKTTAQIIYNGDPSQTSLTKNAYETITIVPPTPMSKEGWLYFSFNSSTQVWGAKLYRAGGDEPTSVAFSGETTIEKFAGNASFIKTAVQTTTPIMSGGTITYKSSDESVATVDAVTGEVTILETGRTNITATLSGYGCFAAATASYALVVKPCTDPACTIAVTAGDANKCSSAYVTLTTTAAAGATFQWYKDGVALLGETNASLTTTAEGDFYVIASKVCPQQSNTVSVTNLTAPTATALHDYYYIKAGRVTPPIKLFQIANASSWDVSPAAPAGCAYELGEDGIIYLTGTPSASLTTGNQNITVTAHNDCGGSDAQATLNLRTLAATAKPQIAWVAIGTHLDGSDVKPTKGETLPGTPDAAKSTSHALYTYLQNYFDMTAVNAYCTTDTKKISDYCSQFDLVLLTDYPDTNVKPDGESGGKEKSYSNAYGCLMDELPLLSFEAFVADCPNWGINTNPKTPSPKQKNMTLLCSAHNIFEHTSPTDEVVEFLSTTEGAGNALQGFTGLEAPPGMLFIATIDNGASEKLIVCCERQKVIEARMMIMGLNYDAMGKVTDDGKTIIKQIIEYLLQYEALADCSMVFDDKNETHIWSDPANWYPAYNTVPKPMQAVRVDKPCTIDVTNAHCSSIRLRKDGSEGWNGTLTILPNAGLTVMDYIKEVHGSNFMTTYPSAAGDLVIQASETGQNGSLVFGNEDNLQAKVEYYSQAEGAKTASPVWQYMGIPVSDRPIAIDQYNAAWMCSWESEGNLSSNWLWVENEDRIVPFKGYCITQAAKKKYIHQGTLCTPVKQVLPLYYFESIDGSGFNMFANSWVAPIDITKMTNDDFNGAEPTVFIYNTGSRAQYVAAGDPSTTGEYTDAGQYNAIPVQAAEYLAGSLTKIPTMQGFFVQASREGSLTLDYERLCFNKTTYSTTAEIMRAPQRKDAEQAEEKIVPEVMRLDVNSGHWGDRVYILTHEEFSDAFDRGWDGSKQEGDELAPMLALPTETGMLAVAAIETAEGRNLSFRAGEDLEYTFTFHYAGDEIYLYDRETGQATLIRTGNTYTFSAMNQAPENRFLITANPPRTPTDIDNIQSNNVPSTKAKKFIYEDKLLIFYRGVIYDALGVPVKTRKEGAQ